MGDTDRIVFSPPDITEDEIEEVIKALKSGWITTGPKCKELEKMMAEYCHTNRLALMNSATACMEMTYRLFGIGEGDEVIVPAYTYTATASAVCHVGAKPVFVDILGDRAYSYEDGTHSPYEPDYEALEKAITPATKVIMPVDIAGVMCDYDRIRDIAISKQDMFTPGDNKYQRALRRILILADSAHGFGSKRAGYMSGEAADFTSFSFHAVKNLTTAEGGASTWLPLKGIENAEIYKMFQLLSMHGQNKDALAKNKMGAWEYDIIGPWYKCNMT
ncbi:MAG TPA: capsular biosynthesis protein, partial [Lachnospiraceae bacterium]|nr:capsular biosynthesis protein [Lachnospiraceae bacterium]